MSTSPSWILSAKWGYFWHSYFISCYQAVSYSLTLYNEPSAPTEHPSSKVLILLTRAAIPHADNRAARLPIRRANARKNCRSARVVSRAKKCVKMPMIINNSSVGSLVWSALVCDFEQNGYSHKYLSISERNAVSKA